MSKAYTGKIQWLKNLGQVGKWSNLKETMFIDDINSKFDNVLLIDDAVGSAATLNETAKIKQMVLPKVYGFAVTGNLKGFEVIREV